MYGAHVERDVVTKFFNSCKVDIMKFDIEIHQKVYSY